MSKFMDRIVNFPVARQIFGTNIGNKSLNGWNKFWLGSADKTDKLSQKIPGNLDDIILHPFRDLMIWLDPVVEEKRKDDKGVMKSFSSIKDNDLLEGYIIRNLETNKIEKGRIELKINGLKGVIYRINMHRLGGIVRKKLKPNSDPEDIIIHGHKGRNEKDHLKIKNNVKVDENLMTKLDKIKDPVELKEMFLSVFERG